MQSYDYSHRSGVEPISWERFVSRVNEKAKLAHAALIERVGPGVES